MVEYKFDAIVPLFFVINKLMPLILRYLIKVMQIKCHKLAAQQSNDTNVTQTYRTLLIRCNYNVILQHKDNCALNIR